MFLYSFTSLHSGANEADMLSAPESDDYTVFGMSSDVVGSRRRKLRIGRGHAAFVASFA